MRVLIAGKSGFCNGVKRAMRIAVEAAARHGGLHADGPLVHNRQAMELLALHGVRQDASDDPLPICSHGVRQDASDEPLPICSHGVRQDASDDPLSISSHDVRQDAVGGPMLVRAHGVEPERRERWRERGLEVVDATCPHVSANQRLAAAAAAAGRTVILAGDADHAEVRAVAACAAGKVSVVADAGGVASVPVELPVTLLAQTTFNVAEFSRIAAAIRQRFPDAVTVDTICRATHDRQAEAARVAGRVEAMVVVGGRHSANTGRLADTARAMGKPVFLVETAEELAAEDFSDYRLVGVTSGASTPAWITQDVVDRLRCLGRPAWLAALNRFGLWLARSRASTALSAGGLALAAQFSLADGLFPDLALACACAVFFSHTLNRRIPDNPVMHGLSLVEGFYRRRRRPLLAAAWLAAGLALWLAAGWGAHVFGFFLSALLASAGYARLRRRTPGGFLPLRLHAHMRSWIMAVAWSVFAVTPFALASGATDGAFGVAAYVFLLCFGGALLRDLHDTVSDRLLGIDTLASGMSHAVARRLTRGVFAAAFALALAFFARLVAEGTAAAPAGAVFTLFAVAAPAWGLLLARELDRGSVPDAVRLGAGVDAMGLLAGAGAFLAAGVPG